MNITNAIENIVKAYDRPGLCLVCVTGVVDGDPMAATPPDHDSLPYERRILRDKRTAAKEAKLMEIVYTNKNDDIEFLDAEADIVIYVYFTLEGGSIEVKKYRGFEEKPTSIDFSYSF